MLRPLLCHTLGILLIALAGLAHAQIYKWTDDQGNTIYSDQPHPNSSQVEPVSYTHLTLPTTPYV